MANNKTSNVNVKVANYDLYCCLWPSGAKKILISRVIKRKYYYGNTYTRVLTNNVIIKGCDVALKHNNNVNEIIRS